MSRIAIPVPLYCLLVLLIVLAPGQARAYELPPCTGAEFRAIFDQIAESQLEAGVSIGTLAELFVIAGEKIEARDYRRPELALCADEFFYRQLVGALSGDFIGRAVLDLGDVPAEENPYRVQLESDLERIEGMAGQMLSVDRNAAPEPLERKSPKCALGQLTTMQGLLAEFEALLESDVDEALANIAALLRWREARLSQAPMCSDGVELALFLSAAATDASAMWTIVHVAPFVENPYDSLLADGESRIDEWRSRINERLAHYNGVSAATGGLPNCSEAELAHAYAQLMPEYSDLLQGGRKIESAAELKSYSEAYFDYRRTNLAQLPVCEAVDALGWEVRQLLGDLIVAAARDLVDTGGGSRIKQALDADSVGVARMIDGMASELEGAAIVPGAGRIETAAACRGTEVLVLQIYVLPAFHDFVAAALATETSAELESLSERSLAIRDMLWRELPRCAEAMELGLLMRRVAADFSAMLWLELAGLPVTEIPQVGAVIDNMSRILERAEALSAEAFSVGQSSKTYYISAGRGANIRACGSTDCAIVETVLRGDAISVIDDSGAWYKLRLPNNQIGYIASFLASVSPPG